MVTPDSASNAVHSRDRDWRPGDWWSAGVRVLLLLVLVAGAATAVASIRPSPRQQQDLIADLAAGRVTYLDYEPSDHSIRWADGWWRWRRTVLETWTGNGDQPPVTEPQGDTALAWLYQQIDASGHQITVNTRDHQQPGWWTEKIAWKPLWAATTAAWIVTFLLMLGRARHRYANRWAWFWLFTFGQAGALLYLMAEPQPVWRPKSWPPTGRTPTRGGAGCLWAILLSIAVSLVGAGIAAL
jgi:hypothetical protein